MRGLQVDKIDFHRRVMKSHVPGSQTVIVYLLLPRVVTPLKEFTARYLLNSGI